MVVAGQTAERSPRVGGEMSLKVKRGRNAGWAAVVTAMALVLVLAGMRVSHVAAEPSPKKEKGESDRLRVKDLPPQWKIWIEEEIYPLLTKQQRRAFLQLESEAQRRAFVPEALGLGAQVAVERPDEGGDDVRAQLFVVGHQIPEAVRDGEGPLPGGHERQDPVDEVSGELLEEAAQAPVLVNQGSLMAVGVVYGFAALKLDIPKRNRRHTTGQLDPVSSTIRRKIQPELGT